MVPIRDENPSYNVPYVTYALILINIVVFVYELSLGENSLEGFFNRYAAVSNKIAPAVGELINGDVGAAAQLTPLITAMFLHGGFLHVAGNMLYLWVFGDNVEDRMGHFGFLVFYLLCGALSILVQVFFNPDSSIPSLGASGAIAGVLGAYIVQFPRAKVQAIFPLGFIPIPFNITAIWFLGWWFVQQAFYGVADLGARSAVGMEQGGVAYWAHAGGFVIGAILVFFFVRDPRSPYQRSR